jgi:hypothetical protein
MFNHMYVISMFSFRYTYPNLEPCQVLFSHFVTRTEDSAAPGSQSSRIVVQRFEEIFCIMGESMVSVLCLCVHKNKNSSVSTRKLN